MMMMMMMMMMMVVVVVVVVVEGGQQRLTYHKQSTFLTGETHLQGQAPRYHHHFQ